MVSIADNASALKKVLKCGLPGPLLTYSSAVIDTTKIPPFFFADSKCLMCPT